jgi:hypothetical protein
VRNEEECVCRVCLFRCNIVIVVTIIKSMPGSLASGTLCRNVLLASGDEEVQYIDARLTFLRGEVQ